MFYQERIADSDLVDGFSVGYLKFFGIWRIINDYRTTGKKNFIIKWLVVMGLSYAIPYLLLQVIGYCFILQVDLTKATIVLLHTMPVLQVFCKILVFWLRLEELGRLYNLVKKDFLNVPEHLLKETRDIYKNVNKQSNAFISMMLFLGVSNVLIIACMPPIPVDYITKHTGNLALVSGGRNKVLTAWYPLPMDTSPYYELVLVNEIIIVMGGGMFLVVSVAFYFQLLMCLYAQFNVLGCIISNLRVEQYETTADSQIYRRLYEVIKDHKKLLSYTEELRSVFNPVVTVILGTGISVLIVSVFLFLFAGIGNLNFVFSSMMFLAYQLLEVAMFCIGSSYIESASSNLQFAIYCSDWYKTDAKFRRTAQMVMVRTTRGITLTAFWMYPINMETFMNIIQFTYTVSTLLSGMNE